jgi:hypothetical protein
MDRSEAGKLGYEKTKEILDYHRQAKSRRIRGEYAANPKLCLTCGEMIPFEKRRSKFCDHSCSASYNNRGVTRNIKGSKICQCGKPKKPHNKYCAACAGDYVYRRIKSVETAKTDEARKRLLIEQRGHRCEDCGLETWKQSPIPLELHHIDGDSDNNRGYNLQLLCRNCHALTDNHKRRNKSGKRQLERRKRYANGQTW